MSPERVSRSTMRGRVMRFVWSARRGAALAGSRHSAVSQYHQLPPQRDTHYPFHLGWRKAGSAALLSGLDAGVASIAKKAQNPIPTFIRSIVASNCW